jgi:hypothetical protein
MMAIRSFSATSAVVLLLCCAGSLRAQTSGGQAAASPWTMQKSSTTASLRGIHAIGSSTAWASGTSGTVLRTRDGGATWQSCSAPPGAENLDFRGIWAWDENTAVVMSSGTGDQSRLYKTTDGCSHWTLLYTNPDKDGFWDAVAFSDRNRGFLLGDPINGRFVLLFTLDGGKSWAHADTKSAGLDIGETKTGAFAASNSAMMLTSSGFPFFGTGGASGAVLYTGSGVCTALMDVRTCLENGLRFDTEKLPLAGNTASAGIFSIAANSGEVNLVAVGGDYEKPNESSGTAARWWSQFGQWKASEKPPHGYRSAVAWDADRDAWIAAGTNGSDISRDDGKTWQPLDSAPEGGSWNAISLPWVVGPKGRIARLDERMLKDRAQDSEHKAQ